MNKRVKIIIGCGGTGGHVYPAIAIANKLKSLYPNTQILFVGAQGKMEMEKVPQSGYHIIGLPVRGLNRRNILKNFSVLYKLFKSIRISFKIIEKFKPDVVVGTGGYASSPIIYAASKKNIPFVLQEQNSFPGITNKIFANKAKIICVAYEGLEKYFPKEKLLLTGNPIREDILMDYKTLKEESLKYFNFSSSKKTLLSLGGSLGAKTINESIYENIELIIKNNIQFIWQTGKDFFPKALELINNLRDNENIRVFSYIERMDYAYAIADLVISRAGAITISELAALGKPAILVPSPNVAEDHQTKNAMVLVSNHSALLIKDSEAKKKLVNEAINLLNNEFKLKLFANNIAKLSQKNASELIAKEILKLANVYV